MSINMDLNLCQCNKYIHYIDDISVFLQTKKTVPSAILIMRINDPGIIYFQTDFGYMKGEKKYKTGTIIEFLPKCFVCGHILYNRAIVYRFFLIRHYDKQPIKNTIEFFKNIFKITEITNNV